MGQFDSPAPRELVQVVQPAAAPELRRSIHQGAPSSLCLHSLPLRCRSKGTKCRSASAHYSGWRSRYGAAANCFGGCRVNRTHPIVRSATFVVSQRGTSQISPLADSFEQRAHYKSPLVNYSVRDCARPVIWPTVVPLCLAIPIISRPFQLAPRVLPPSRARVTIGSH